MDLSLLIRERLKELGMEQKDLANAAQVTESYVSQLLARKKTPPAPDRTDLYRRMSSFLGFPDGELSKLAELERQEALKKKVASPPAPLFKECRNLVLRKCEPARQNEVRAIFAREPFGEFERLVTQQLLDVAKRVAREQLSDHQSLQLLAQLSSQDQHRLRTLAVEFLDTDVFNISLGNCAIFLDPLIESWDVDLKTFAVDVVLNRRLVPGPAKRFEFTETAPAPLQTLEPGLAEFLRDSALSGDATEEEVDFLRSLRFRERRPSVLYYYRELQSLRDPLHFPITAHPKLVS